MEMLAAGALDFRILHRFGNINEGYKQFFGLDNATMRMGFDYGITKILRLDLEGALLKRTGWISKVSYFMAIDRREIYACIRSLTSGFVRNGEENPLSDRELKVTFERRMSYYHQLIIGRKFTERISAQISPTVIHTNIVNNELIPNDLLAIGIGGRFKFTKRMAFVIDYAYPMNNFPRDLSTHPLSIGIDIETGGHVFQLHFSNATGMNERAFINEENGKWLDGDIQFGFNLPGFFKLRKIKFNLATIS